MPLSLFHALPYLIWADMMRYDMHCIALRHRYGHHGHAVLLSVDTLIVSSDARHSVAPDAAPPFLIDVDINVALLFDLRGDQWAFCSNLWWKMKTKSDFESGSTRRILSRSHRALCDPERSLSHRIRIRNNNKKRARWRELSRRRESRREEKHQESNTNFNATDGEKYWRAAK